MAGEWTEFPIGELVEIFDGPHATPSKAKSGPIFLGISNLSQGRLDLSNSEHLTEEDYARWTRRVTPRPGDVVFSYETRLGEAALIPASLRCCLGRRMGLLRPRHGKVDSRFLLYTYLGPRFQETLRSRTIHGSTVDRIPLIEMAGFPIAITEDINEQRAIAHILGTLDDKIDLNRRMNQTLEAMARALFKSWFVDFDPVRAKHALSKVEGVESRPSTSSGQAFPGLPKPLADLFPDSFEDSELGEIPKGWKVEPLSEITTTITKGTTPTQGASSTADKGDGRINYVRVNSIGEDGAVLFDKLIKIPKSVHLGVLKRSILQANDVLYTIAGTIGRTAIVDESLLPANTNQAVAVVRPKQAIPAIFLAMTMQESTFREELHSNIVQAVQANLSLGTLSRARTVIPPRDTLVELFMPIADFAKRVASSRSESRALAALRDTLLPKLISGELRVNAAELISGAVM